MSALTRSCDTAEHGVDFSVEALLARQVPWVRLDEAERIARERGLTLLSD